ncbi:MAG: bifunctional methylenetetrahydrofolate dehydrogenase/methenyltetrahydrofolate cyclohydrolase [Planctomycetota bacterium]|nr:bifunctional methylenetetrahydrofolate dehydrogenase/methenyltetrahydrofolate cyclohydrolase [Planctomycetota bacterium]
MVTKVKPGEVAKRYRAEVRSGVEGLDRTLKLVGFLSDSSGTPSHTYADYTRRGCEDVGIDFELRTVPRLELEAAVREANVDPELHGILIYYPIFGTGQDAYLKDLIDRRKDVEGLNSFWIRRLYKNVRYVNDDPCQKSILPCTPLAIMKMLDACGVMDKSQAKPLAGKVITVFNRSEVVGRPLASMMSNDGARVYSFDVDGPILFEGNSLSELEIKRGDALAESDVVITGVPSKAFDCVKASEINDSTVCLNFATIRNFEKAVKEKARIYVPRVGPVTVAMCLRNTLRLYRNFHSGSGVDIKEVNH